MHAKLTKIDLRELLTMDFTRFIDLVKGGLFEPDRTWAAYAAKRAPWLDTAIAFTLPLIVISALLSLILGFVFSSVSLFGGAGIGGFFVFSITGVISVALWAVIASFFARMFEESGTNSTPMSAPTSTPAPAPADTPEQPDPDSPAGAATFDQGLAAISFAFLPGFIGSVLGTLPWIGGLFALAGLIYGVVLMYRNFPVFLGVTEDNRPKHFIATIISGLVAGFVVFALLGAIGLGSASVFSGASSQDYIDDAVSEHIERSVAETTGGGNSDGDFLGIGRQSDYVEAATSDRFAPPADGRLSDAQVELFIRFMKSTKELREQTGKRLQEISEKADNDESPSLGDIFGGLRDVMDIGTAEMQVVKSGGGNWAEHEWVKKTLFEASVHKDLNDAIRHNWVLYTKHAEALEDVL